MPPYCEMQARENTEPDLLDNAYRALPGLPSVDMISKHPPVMMGISYLPSILVPIPSRYFHSRNTDSHGIFTLAHLSAMTSVSPLVPCHWAVVGRRPPLMYGEQSKYAHDSGGLSRYIATLTNEEVRAYHRRVYTCSNMGCIISGQVEPEAVLQVWVHSSSLTTYRSDYGYHHPPCSSQTP